MPYITQPTRVFVIAHMNSSQVPPSNSPKAADPAPPPAPSDIEIEASGPFRNGSRLGVAWRIIPVGEWLVTPI